MLANCIIGISIGCWLIASRLPTGCCVDGEFDFSFGASDSGDSNDVVVVFEGDTAVLTCSTDPSMAVDVLFTSAKPSPPSSSGTLTVTAGGRSQVLMTNGSLSDDRQRRLSIETKTKLISRHELVMRNVRVNDSGVYRCKSGNQLSNGLVGQPIKLQVKQRSNVGRGHEDAVDQWRQLYLKLFVVFFVTLIAFLFLQWRLTTFRSNLPNMRVSKKSVLMAFNELPSWKPMSQTWFQRSDLAELLIGFGTHPVVAVAICARVHPRKVGIGTSLESKLLFGKPLVVLTAVYYAILGLVATLIVPDSLKFVASKTEEIIESVQELSGDELALAFGHYVDFKLLTVLTFIFALALAAQLCLFLTTGLFASFLACCGSEQQYITDDHRHHAANQRPLAPMPNAASHLLRHESQADDVIE